MPSRIAAHKKSVTISIPRFLVEKIDAIAALTNRSRTYVIEHLIRSQIEKPDDGIAPDKHVLAALQAKEE